MSCEDDFVVGCDCEGGDGIFLATFDGVDSLAGSNGDEVDMLALPAGEIISVTGYKKLAAGIRAFVLIGHTPRFGKDRLGIDMLNVFFDELFHI